MTAHQLITDDILEVSPSDRIEKVLQWMEEFNMTVLPVVSNRGMYLGVIHDFVLLGSADKEKPISHLNIPLPQPAIFKGKHLYDVISAFGKLDINFLPVIGDKAEYLGVISLDHFIKSLSEISSLNQAGSVVILEVNERDYSLHEISQIVEENDARILNSFISAKPDSTTVYVTIKINKEDVRPIIQSFERFGYTISNLFTEDSYNKEMNDRYEQFMNYLNM
ncbi:MAG: acetoin utilization protein AcuB [Flavobacteriales bacterium]|jgi:acetoin utilization protein AcuB